MSTHAISEDLGTLTDNPITTKIMVNNISYSLQLSKIIWFFASDMALENIK